MGEDEIEYVIPEDMVYSRSRLFSSRLNDFYDHSIKTELVVKLPKISKRSFDLYLNHRLNNDVVDVLGFLDYDSNMRMEFSRLIDLFAVNWRLTDLQVCRDVVDHIVKTHKKNPKHIVLEPSTIQKAYRTLPAKSKLIELMVDICTGHHPQDFFVKNREHLPAAFIFDVAVAALHAGDFANGEAKVREGAAYHEKGRK